MLFEFSELTLGGVGKHVNGGYPRSGTPLILLLKIFEFYIVHLAKILIFYGFDKKLQEIQ
jgi:hypothetical protein